MRFTPRAALALGLSLTLLFVGTGARADRASATTPQDEQVFIGLINNLRTEKGLQPLAVHAELTTLARAWSSTMASSDQLVHSPDMSAGLTASWTVLGENVGVHGVHDIHQLFDAFVASPPHYQNLVDPRFNFVGVGVFNTDGGKLWTTHRFMAAEPPSTTTAPTTATTTTTTSAPTTTIPASTSPATSPTTTPPAPTPTAAAPETTPAPVPVPPTAATSTTTPAITTATETSTEAGTGPVTPAKVPPAAAPQAEPDVETVEQVLMELLKAGI